MPPEIIPAEPLWFLDTLVTIRVAHGEGDDGLSVIENRARHGDSPPLHVHHSEDELFHILEGDFRFVVGGEERRGGPGDLILTRRGIPHTYRVESPEGGRWLTITTRGDFENFVRELGRPAERPELPSPSEPPSPEQAQALAAVALRHRIELVGPPLT
ncbi:MAG TPA: cupin domain-containing protein [Longimicrobiaceae bacterium]